MIVHRKMGLNPYKCDVSAIILHISQERGRNQTGAGSHCETRPERHKVLYKKICFASVIFDIVIFIFSTKLWKQKVVSIGSHLCIACIQHYLVKFDYHENFPRFFYQKKKFQLPQYVPYSLPGFCQPHNEYHKSHINPLRRKNYEIQPITAFNHIIPFVVINHNDSCKILF